MITSGNRPRRLGFVQKWVGRLSPVALRRCLDLDPFAFIDSEWIMRYSEIGQKSHSTACVIHFARRPYGEGVAGSRQFGPGSLLGRKVDSLATIDTAQRRIAPTMIDIRLEPAIRIAALPSLSEGSPGISATPSQVV